MALAVRTISAAYDNQSDSIVEEHMPSFTDYTAPRRQMEWKRAWRALRILIRDSERTDQVFEISRALAGNSWERNFRKFCAHPEGRRGWGLDLMRSLMDEVRLESVDDGTRIVMTKYVRSE